jgi:hypothetical protein
VTVQKLTTTDAFVVVDLDGAPVADGVARWAKKVLVDGARWLARSRTYAWAVLEEQVSGASAGISAPPESRTQAVAAFVAELEPRVAAGELGLDPAKGLSADDLAPLTAVDPRSALGSTGGPTGTLADALLGAGIAAAAGASLGDLDGATVVVEGAGGSGPAVVEALISRGARVVGIATPSGTVAVGPDADTDELVGQWTEAGDGLPAARGSDLPPTAALGLDADVLVCGSKIGLVDHDVAASLPQRLVVPCGPLPVTARGLAVARRRDITVLADFVTTAGPLLAFRPAEGANASTLLDATDQRIRAVVEATAGHDEGPLLGACLQAESFLRTWRDELPFGRPLA